jgi:Alpha galactosidase A
MHLLLVENACICSCIIIGLCDVQPDYVAQAKACNLARNCHDIDDSWDSARSIIDCYGDNEDDFASVAGPGYFNDPDMVNLLIVFRFMENFRLLDVLLFLLSNS